MADRPARFADAHEMARAIVERLGPELRIGLPLGLGKPVTLVNALTRLAAADPSIRLSIFTALTLEVPEPRYDMERRFLAPARDRLFGRYPALDYARMLRDGSLPANIEVREFFLLAGRWLGVDAAQQDYISANYTHAVRILAAQRPNLVLQLLATEGDRISLSCNTDVTADLLAFRREGELDFLLAGELNPELPFMGGEAACPVAEADLLLDPPEPFELFSSVKRPVGDVEHAIGLHVSRLIPDGGTIQIGIGAIGDAAAHALLLRHRGEIAPVWQGCPFPQDDFTEAGSFETGLYAVTEMLVDGLLQLFEAGVVRREVDGAAIHAAFFVDSRDFYTRLREMDPDARARIAMKPVSFTNQLYGDEPGRRAARQQARFVNAAMKVTLLGSAISDTTSDGQVVSGVGGQYNFVSQALELEGGRSIITLPATRTRGGRPESNIVASGAHETIPRHLRDIVVTEYGIADLRGRTDAEVAAAMIDIADSRFQPKLLEEAQSAGKLPRHHQIPPIRRANLPPTVTTWLQPFRPTTLPDFPFGTDFDATERRLLPALARLRSAQGSRTALLRLVARGARVQGTHREALARMALDRPSGWRERLTALALAGALDETEPDQR